MRRQLPAAGMGATIATALTVLVGVAGVAPSAADFNRMSDAIAALDDNRDGAVDRAEWKIAGQRTFDALDGDENGVIGPDEYFLLRAAMFAVVDTNHDGRITADEADAYKRLPWTLGLAR